MGSGMRRGVIKRGARFRAVFYMGRDPVSGKEKRLTKQFATEYEARSWPAKTRTEIDTGWFVRPSKICQWPCRPFARCSQVRAAIVPGGVLDRGWSGSSRGAARSMVPARPKLRLSGWR
jgi:hypothetical protein